MKIKIMIPKNIINDSSSWFLDTNGEEVDLDSIPHYKVMAKTSARALCDELIALKTLTPKELNRIKFVRALPIHNSVGVFSDNKSHNQIKPVFCKINKKLSLELTLGKYTFGLIEKEDYMPSVHFGYFTIEE